MRSFESLSEEQVAALRADLSRAIARTCPAWLADSRDDLVQMALLKVIEILRQREDNAELSSFYLHKAAYCAVVDEIRRRRRRGEVPLVEDPMEDEIRTAPALDAPSPERRAMAREAGEAIRECLARLIRPRRLATTLHLQGHAVAEVSRLLGWDAKKADNLVYRGLADLRACLRLKGVRP